MGGRMGLRRRKRKMSGWFVEDQRLGKRIKSAKLSGLKERRFSSNSNSNNKPYVSEPVDEDYARLLDSLFGEPAEEMDADFPGYLKSLGLLVDENIDAGVFASNGGGWKKEQKKKKKKKCGEESLAGESIDKHYGMFLDRVREEAGSYLLKIRMGDGKWSWLSYEALDCGLREGGAEMEGGEGINGDLDSKERRRGGACTQSEFRLARNGSSVVGRESMNKAMNESSCGRTSRKTSGTDSSSGNGVFDGESRGDDDTRCVDNVSVDEPPPRGVDNVAVDEPLDGEYEAFLEHLIAHETSYMLNVTTRDGESICFLYETEDCSTMEGSAEGEGREGNDDLQLKKRKGDEVCIRSKFSVDQQKSSLVGTINENGDGSSSGMQSKNCQPNLSTSDANQSSGFRVSDACNVASDEPPDGEYEMFLEHLTAYETSYVLDVTTRDGKRTCFMYGAADEDLQYKKRADEGICIRSANSESPMVGREGTINKTKCGSNRGSEDSSKAIDSTRRPTTEPEIAVSTVSKVRLMELPNSGDALGSKKERSLEACRDPSQQLVAIQNPEIVVSTVNKAWLMEPRIGRDALRAKKERGIKAYRDLSQQLMATHNPKTAVSTVNKARLMELPNSDDALRTKKRWNDDQRSEAMNRPIPRKQSADKEPGIEDLDSTKQCREEEGGRCDDQADKFSNSQMRNSIVDVKAIKQEAEEVHPMSPSNSDDLIEIDPATISHDNNTPFLLTNRPELIVVQYDDDEEEQEEHPTATNNHSEFRSKLTAILRQPYNDEEYEQLLAEVSRPRQKPLDDEMSRSSRAKRPPGLSYLDQHKDFAKKLAEVEIGQGLELHRARTLNLLRGFVYFLQKLPVEGAFKPWMDKLCLEVLPPLKCGRS